MQFQPLSSFYWLRLPWVVVWNLIITDRTTVTQMATKDATWVVRMVLGLRLENNASSLMKG